MAHLESQVTDRWFGVWNAEEIDIVVIERRCNFIAFHSSRFRCHGYHFALDITTAIDEARARDGPHE